MLIVNIYRKKKIWQLFNGSQVTWTFIWIKELDWCYYGFTHSLHYILNHSLIVYRCQSAPSPESSSMQPYHSTASMCPSKWTLWKICHSQLLTLTHTKYRLIQSFYTLHCVNLCPYLRYWISLGAFC